VAELCLGSRPDISHSHFTIQGLMQLVRHCPDLQDLTIAVDASMNSYVAGSLEDRHVFSKKPVSLDLGISRITRVEPVAMFLTRLFPDLREVSGQDERRDGTRWRQVKEYVDVIKQVRREERSWWIPDDKDRT